MLLLASGEILLVAHFWFSFSFVLSVLSCHCFKASVSYSASDIHLDLLSGNVGSHKFPWLFSYFDCRK